MQVFDKWKAHTDRIANLERQLAEARAQIAKKDEAVKYLADENFAYEKQIAARLAALVEARGLFAAILVHIDQHSFSLAKGLAAQGIHGLNAALSQPAQPQPDHAALVAVLRGIKWKSIDRDNMEFTARITYSQMDAINAALSHPAPAQEDQP